MTDVPQPIIITGFMGAGKTTVAAALAQKLGCHMLDLDRSIVERSGRAIHEMIEKGGEASFREAETKALRDALEQSTAGVIALGGGAWTIERNRLLIAEHRGYTIWLDAPFDLCWRRIMSCREDVRPLARGKEQSNLLYDERRSLYELAALRIEAGEDRSAEEIAAEIINVLLQNEQGT